MSKKLIDNIFTYDSYRYVPEDLKLEWKTLYNYYSTKYFDKQHKIFSIFPQNRIDFYNEEILRIDRLLNICNKFKENIKNLQPKYNIDINYSERIKNELNESISKIEEFLNIKNMNVNKNVSDSKIPLRRIKENYDGYQEKELTENKYFLLCVIVLIYILFILLLNNSS